MDTLLERLTSSQIVAVISVVCGCCVALAMIFAITKYQFQLLADDTALKRERQQAELAMRQKVMERGSAGGPSLDALLTPDGVSREGEEERVNAELAKRFGAVDVSQDGGEEVEDTLRRAMTASAARKATIVEVMDELLENQVPTAAVVAAVRPLCDTPAAERKRVVAEDAGC